MAYGNKTEIIIQAARKLFYEFGYTETSFEKIASECGIQKQAITNYFGTKAKLAEAVYGQYTGEFLEVFRIKAHEMGNENIFYSNSAMVLWLSRYYKEEKKAFRFYESYEANNLNNFDHFEDSYKRGLGDKDPSVLRTDSIYLSSYYAARGLLLQYCRGNLDLPHIEFEKKYFYYCILPFFPSRDEIRRIYIYARTILDRINIEIKPNFVIE